MNASPSLRQGGSSESPFCLSWHVHTRENARPPLRDGLDAQRAALQQELERHDEASRRELATRADLRETELRLQVEMEKIRAELKTDMEKVRTDVERVKYDLLKWQIGSLVALAAIMARGFGWRGF